MKVSSLVLLISVLTLTSAQIPVCMDRRNLNYTYLESVSENFTITSEIFVGNSIGLYETCKDKYEYLLLEKDSEGKIRVLTLKGKMMILQRSTENGGSGLRH